MLKYPMHICSLINLFSIDQIFIWHIGVGRPLSPWGPPTPYALRPTPCGEGYIYYMTFYFFKVHYFFL